MEFHFLPTIPLIILITISYYQSQNMVFAQQEQYDICSKPFQCANISEIDYPFWGSSRPSYCGHPDFQLSCNSQIASITFSGLTYEVLKIDNSSQVLTVARTDYISDICPAHLQNATIDTNFFSTLDIKNVTIYYGCMSTISVNASFPWISSQFTCNINKADMSCYFLTSVLSSVTSGFFGTCKENVVVQANETVANSFLNMPNPSQTDLTIVLDQGFGLKWDANNTDETCRTCKVSGGACGYDSSSSSFVCFCSDQAYMSRCNGTVHPPVHSAEGMDLCLIGAVSFTASKQTYQR